MCFPGLIQLLDGLFESHRGVSMAPARVEVNQGDTRHLEPILARTCGGIGLFRPDDFMQMGIIQSVYLIALY